LRNTIIIQRFFNQWAVPEKSALFINISHAGATVSYPYQALDRAGITLHSVRFLFLKNDNRFMRADLAACTAGGTCPGNHNLSVFPN
jgi:hypothetical protein